MRSSHIAHPEVLARADRLFGMSFELLQETQNSLTALSILARGTAITMLTDEWTNNPLRAAAAAHARRVAYALWTEQAASLRAQAQEYGITAADVAEAARGTASHFGGKACAGKNSPAACLASALANRGRANGNKATTCRNPDVLRLGEQIGSEVMGPERWKKYITTSAKHMNEADKPVPSLVSNQWTKERIGDERKGWMFHHITMTASRWTMKDKITYMLPGSTKENPLMHVESLQEAIEPTHDAAAEVSSGLPTNRFVSTTKKSMKCGVNWISIKIRVRSRNTQPHLN